jgi:hypothetical protein
VLFLVKTNLAVAEQPVKQTQFAKKILKGKPK